MFRHTERPRPVPTPTGLVVKNGSKMRGRTLGIDARPVVPHLHDDAPARVDGGADADVAGTGTAVVGEGLRGVDEQVQENLCEARLAGHDPRNGRKIGHHAGAVARLVGRHPNRRAKHVAHVDGRQLVIVDPREGPQIARDEAHALDAVANVFERLARLFDLEREPGHVGVVGVAGAEQLASSVTGWLSRMSSSRHAMT